MSEGISICECNMSDRNLSRSFKMGCMISFTSCKCSKWSYSLLKVLDFPAFDLFFFSYFFLLPFPPLFYSRQRPNKQPCLSLYWTNLLMTWSVADQNSQKSFIMPIPYSSNCGINFMPWRFSLMCTKLFAIFHLPKSLNVLFESPVFYSEFYKIKLWHPKENIVTCFF